MNTRIARLPGTVARAAFALTAFALTATVAPAAHALVTYTYVGPALTDMANAYPGFPVSATGLVASFVLASPLPANIGSSDAFHAVLPLSWSVTGGGYTMTSADANAALSGDQLNVFTDASGSPVGWDFLAYFNTGVVSNGPRFRSSYFPTGPFQTDGTPVRVDVVAYYNMPLGINQGEYRGLTGGSWSVISSPVPEPSPAALLLAGVGVLGWVAMGRRTRSGVGGRPLLSDTGMQQARGRA